MKKSFSCYIITENSLGIQCAEVLLSENHQILGIISNNPEIILWSLDHQVPFFETLEDFKNIKPSKTFDYLFSIINSQVLSSQLLEYPTRYAINYHDAPLPKYAGVHATSWALLNDEKTHGVSWHLMSSLVDGGDILKQRMFSIEKGDSALTLNLKCYTQAIEAFKEVVQDLSHGSISLYPQDLEQRTYYSVHQKPQVGGIVDWNTPAQDIERIHRALYFGDYINELGTFKILIGREVFIPHKIKVLEEKSEETPGTIIKVNEKGFQITTKTENIVVENIININKEGSLYSDFRKDYPLHIGSKLKTFSKKNKVKLSEKLSLISPYERYWVNQFLKSVSVQLPFIETCLQNRTDNQDSKSKECRVLNCDLDANLIELSFKEFKESSFSNIVTTIFKIYLSRLGSSESFRIDYTDSSLKDFTHQLEPFLSQEIPLVFESTFNNLTVGEAFQRLIEEKRIAFSRKTFCFDIRERYSSLNNSLYTKSQVKIKVLEDGEKPEHSPLHHLLEVFIDEKQKRCYLGFNEDTVTSEGKNFIENIPGHINTLLKNILKKTKETIQNIPFLTPQEERQLLIEWNDTKVEYSDKTIYQLFEVQAEKTPDNIAVIFENKRLTYKELNKKSNQLFHYLKLLQET